MKSTTLRRLDGYRTLLDEAMQSLEHSDRTAVCFVISRISPCAKSARRWAQAKTRLRNASAAPSSPCGNFLETQSSSERQRARGLISANAIQAAPFGLAATFATGAVLAAGTLSSSTAIPSLKLLL